jgi:PPK2 family polyphosphate:nucleotide phosphotransferase
MVVTAVTLPVITTLADMAVSMRDLLRVPRGRVDLTDYDTDARLGVPSGKAGKPKNLKTDAATLQGLQERLFAEATAGDNRSVLLVLQGTDTAGKGGVVTHVVGSFEPMGVEYTAWKKPTPEEAAHHFLWRIRRRLPRPGVIGVFDRSHYEDVLVPRVHAQLPADQIGRRYEEINRFESELTAAGTTIVKCFLHISKDTQRDRLLARLDDDTKHWKFNPHDLAERARWSDYQAAYEVLLSRCNTAAAPWYVVPSDSKKYRNWAVGRLLHETLAELDPRYPKVDLDVAALTAELEAS